MLLFAIYIDIFKTIIVLVIKINKKKVQNVVIDLFWSVNYQKWLSRLHHLFVIMPQNCNLLCTLLAPLVVMIGLIVRFL